MNSYSNVSKSDHRAFDIFSLDMIQLPPHREGDRKDGPDDDLNKQQELWYSHYFGSKPAARKQLPKQRPGVHRMDNAFEKGERYI